MTEPTVVTKRCSTCKEYLPLASFNKSRAFKDGLRYDCRACTKLAYAVYRETSRQKSRAWYWAHRDESLERSRTWAKANPDAASKRKQEWYERNIRSSKRLASKVVSDRKFRDTHPGYWVPYAKQRRALKRNAPVADFSQTQWLDTIATFNGHCAYCLCEFTDSNNPTQEHMQPLSKRGEHTQQNIIPVCRSCNSKKHNKTLLEFAGASLGSPLSRLGDTAPSSQSVDLT